MTIVSPDVQPVRSTRSKPPIDLNRAVIPGPREMTGHAWRLKGSAASLVSLLGTRTLALQGAEPTWAEQYATLPAAGGNALLTEIEDRVDLRVTLGMVFRYSFAPGGPVMLWNNRQGSTGISVFILGGNDVSLNIAGAPVDSALGFSRDVWNFVGVSMDLSLPADNVRIFGKNRPMQTLTIASHQPGAGKLAIGRQFDAGAATWDCAYPFAYPNQFADAGAFAAMLARVEKRLEPDGIVIADAVAAEA